MNCIHCDEPNPHPGTRKCTDIQACDGRQEYARGVADERARAVEVIAELEKALHDASDGYCHYCRTVGENIAQGHCPESPTCGEREQAWAAAAAKARGYERGEHEREGT